MRGKTIEITKIQKLIGSLQMIRHGSNLKDSIRQFQINATLDEKLVKDLSNFNKQDGLIYQNEFRILFEDEKAVQQIFNIGSTNDLCIEIDVNKKYILERIDNEQFLINMITK
jgi:hypothetical protein